MPRMPPVTSATRPMFCLLLRYFKSCSWCVKKARPSSVARSHVRRDLAGIGEVDLVGRRPLSRGPDVVRPAIVRDRAVVVAGQQDQRVAPVRLRHRRLVGHAAVDHRLAVPERQVEHRRDGGSGADQVDQPPVAGRLPRIHPFRRATPSRSAQSKCGPPIPDAARPHRPMVGRHAAERGQQVRTAGGRSGSRRPAHSPPRRRASSSQRRRRPPAVDPLMRADPLALDHVVPADVAGPAQSKASASWVQHLPAAPRRRSTPPTWRRR